MKTRYFLDTEFVDNGRTIDLISIGIVCDDGREYYAVNQEARLDLANDWVRKNVLPQLPPYGAPEWKTREQIRQDVEKFMTAWIETDALKSESLPSLPPVRAADIEVWSYFADYDWIALCQLFGPMMALPTHFPMYCMDLKQLSVLLGSPEHPQQESGEHNALEDARWNKRLFKFLLNYAYQHGDWGAFE
jgi:3'-5' exoribonuclease-like protein